MQPELRLIHQEVALSLHEDIGSGDVSAALLPEALVVDAKIIAREPLLLCGQAWVEAAFHVLDPSIQVDWHYAEGEFIDFPATLCDIYGHARAILSAERTALNFLQTLSATATQTHRFAELIKGYKARLLDTRKTIPGLRIAQKYAVHCGGGVNHRMGLYDAFLIKENHIAAYGSITQAIAAARGLYPQLFLEIEVETIEQLKEALMAKPDRILLDNFSLTMLENAVKINQSYACKLEASGGINALTIQSVAATGIDFISVGCITKSIQAIDLSLLIKERS